MSILSGVRIVEIAGLGPGPFCAMVLADLGADVILVERPTRGDPITELGSSAIYHRGKRSIGLDLKSPAGAEMVLRLIEGADGLIEGMRPGVMERLGLGPEVCLARNPKLVYGRMTGWGQSGPLAHTAGHDINYIGVSGAQWYAGQPGQPPLAPPTVVGDIGGALYLAIGLLAGIMNARASGKGDVIDSAVVDCSAHMLTILLSLKAAGRFENVRGQSALDGSPWYGAYRCADGNFISIGPVEPKFFALLLDKLGMETDLLLAQQYERSTWPAQKQLFAEMFIQKSRDEWCQLFNGTDACFSPVLNFDEASLHPHNRERGVYVEHDGIVQPGSAPRFANHPSRASSHVPRHAEHTKDILLESGLNAAEIDSLRSIGAIV